MAIAKQLPQSSGYETKCRLLQTTEKLFAEHGFAGVTMRRVAKLGNTNLASAHYHFGSKESMVLEMLKSRVKPINQMRLKLLAESRNLANGKALSIKTILSALISPIGDEISKSSHSRLILAQLVARSFTEPARFIEKMHRKFFSELSEVFMTELRFTYPQVRDVDLYWNFHLAISSMLGALAQHRRLNDISKGNCNENDTQALIDRLVIFTANGFEAGIKNSVR